MTVAEPSSQATVVQLQSPGGLLTVDAAIDGLDRLSAPTKTVITVNYNDAVGSHIFVGDILAPEETQVVVDRIVDFVRDNRQVR